MHSVFFENIHTASPDFPYIDTKMRDINYLTHFHEEIEIVVIISGSTDITCDNSCFRVKEGDICIFMPVEIHSFVSSALFPCTIYVPTVTSLHFIFPISSSFTLP